MADDAAAIEGRRHCTHWIKGECRYGGLCRFEHDGARKGEQAKVESGGKPSHRHGARGKDLRHAAVRRYMVDRWGSLEGLRVVEVAGGSCDLASELCNLAGCEVTVVEPRLAMQKGIQRYQRRLRLGMLHRSPELGGQPIRSAAECAGSPTILPRHARCFFTETLAAAAAAAAGSSPPLCAAVEEQRRLFAAHFGTPSTAEGRGVGPEKKKKKQKMNEKQGGNQKSCTDARLPSNEPPGSEPQRQDGSKHTRSGQGDGGPVDKAYPHRQPGNAGRCPVEHDTSEEASQQLLAAVAECRRPLVPSVAAGERPAVVGIEVGARPTSNEQPSSPALTMQTRLDSSGTALHTQSLAAEVPETEPQQGSKYQRSSPVLTEQARLDSSGTANGALQTQSLTAEVPEPRQSLNDQRSSPVLTEQARLDSSGTATGALSTQSPDAGEKPAVGLEAEAPETEPLQSSNDERSSPVLTEQVRADPAGRFDAPGEGKPAVVKGHARMDLDEGGTVTAPDEPAILHSVRSALEALAQADVVVAVHPDEPTEPVVDWCLARRLPFVVVPCCVFARSNRQRRVAGEPLAPVTTYEQFIAYLLAKATPDGRPIEAVSLPFSGRNIALVYRPEDETVLTQTQEPTVHCDGEGR